MSNLYELSKEVDIVIHEVIDAEGELSEELEKRLNESSLAFRDKASNIAKWTLNVDSDIESMSQEIARLNKRITTRINLKKRLFEYLKFCMENAGLNKVDYPSFTIALQNNPPSVEITDETKLPVHYIKTVQTTSIDKKQILSDLKQGEVSGARLVTEKTHIRIK